MTFWTRFVGIIGCLNTLIVIVPEVNSGFNPYSFASWWGAVACVCWAWFMIQFARGKQL